MAAVAACTVIIKKRRQVLYLTNSWVGLFYCMHKHFNPEPLRASYSRDSGKLFDDDITCKAKDSSTEHLRYNSKTHHC